MAKLVQLDKFRLKYGIEDSHAVNEVIVESLESVSLHLETLLPSKLLRHTTTDIFWVHPYEAPFGIEYVKVLLNSAFLEPQSVVVKTDNRLSTLTQDSQLLDASLLILNESRGFVYLLNPELYESGLAVSVEYTAGFLEEPDGEYGTYYVGVPGWLQEVATMLTMDAVKTRLYNDNSALPENKITPIQLLKPYLRYDTNAQVAVGSQWK